MPNIKQSDLDGIQNLMFKGEYREALTALDHLTQSSPNEASLYVLGGSCFNAIDNFNQAILCYEQAIKIKPDYAEAYYSLGICLEEIDEIDKSILNYNAEIKNKPNYAEAHNNLGNLFAHTSKPNKALLHFKKAIKNKPDYAEAHNNLGNLLKEQGKKDEAILSYKKSIELKPDSTMAYQNLASIYIELGQMDEANKFSALAQGRDKNFEKGLLMFENKNFTQAIKLFEQSKTPGSEEKVLECHYRNKDFKIFKEKMGNYKNKSYSPLLACLSSHYAQNFKTEDTYNFCPSPLNFVCHEKIPELIENDYQLTKEIINDIDNAELFNREQSLFNGSSGKQSAGHLFKNPEKSFKKLSDALIKSIHNYYLLYQHEDNEFIRSFPKNIKFCSSWYIKFFQGGHLTSHIHDYGWISGAVYLAMPKESGRDGQEGAIELTVDAPGFPKLHDEFEKKVILPSVGDVIFFPSPLHHRTIPYTSNEVRICIAFDVEPIYPKGMRQKVIR